MRSLSPPCTGSVISRSVTSRSSWRVSCAHRGEAFEAGRMLIDDLKSRVPIWKHQTFGDGTDEWVGLP